MIQRSFFLIAKVPIYNSSYISEKTKRSILPNLKQPNQDRMILGTSSAHKKNRPKLGLFELNRIAKVVR